MRILHSMSSRLARIVANLLRHVPDPPKPVARPSKSFAGLKVGQLVHDNTFTWTVVSTDSQGASLQCDDVPSKDTRLRLEDRDWKARGWSRVRAPRKRKEPTK